MQLCVTLCFKQKESLVAAMLLRTTKDCVMSIKKITPADRRLGEPLPNSAHAVSVSLPLWSQVVLYEEKNPEVLAALKSGYPRFVFHPEVQRLFKLAEEQYAGPGEFCLLFPSIKTAENCLKFVSSQSLLLDSGTAGRIFDFASTGVFGVALPHACLKEAKDYWQHFGAIISSRQALAILEKREVDARSSLAKQALCERIARLAGAQAEDVRLFPSGMNSIACVHSLLTRISPGEKTIQLGFPYTDTLKLQQKAGAGVEFFPLGNEEDLNKLDQYLAEFGASGVFCEFPSNPLLYSVDLSRLRSILRRRNIPLVLDDSLSSFYNVSLLSYADVLVTSLTKFFSGAGDVMGGSLVLAPVSPFYSVLSGMLKEEYEDLFWAEDALKMEENSRDFAQRMEQINTTAEKLCDYLISHPRVEQVFYPKYVVPDNYNLCCRENGSYGGVFSLLLQEAASKAEPFFDRLDVCKGPSFGTNFTLACPYSFLVHYRELDWAQACGISRYLIRVSVGLEEPEDLISRFKEALG